MKFTVKYQVSLEKSEESILLLHAKEQGLDYPKENTKIADKRTILKRLFETNGTNIRGMKK